MMRNSSSHTRPAKSDCITDKVTVVLLAGNLGFRMKTYGPQCLQDISTGPLLDRQIKNIVECIPNAEIMITCRDYVERLLRSKPDYVRLIESQIEDTNEVEEIRLALNNTVTDNVMFIQSDTFFDKNVIKDLDFSRSFVIYENKGMMRSDSIGMTIVNGKATIMSHALDNKWGRIFHVNKLAKRSLNNFCKQEANKKMYSHEALSYVMDKYPIYSYEAKGRLYCIDRVDDLKGLEEL